MCVVAAWVALWSENINNTKIFIPALAVAILFNPVVPFEFDREVWAIIDITVAIWMVLMALVCLKEYRTEPADE